MSTVPEIIIHYQKSIEKSENNRPRVSEQGFKSYQPHANHFWYLTNLLNKQTDYKAISIKQ